MTRRKPGSGRPATRSRARIIVGWREWVALPDLGIPPIPAKIDTGARSSSLHASKVVQFDREGRTWVRFRFDRPLGRERTGQWCEAPLAGVRRIRSSTGHLQNRFVLETTILLAGLRWRIEVNLADRAEMGFEMLIGRSAIRNRFLVHPGRSYLTSGPEPAAVVPPRSKPPDEEE